MTDLESFIVHYGYIGMYIVLILGIVGMPFPDEVLLTYVGYHVSLGNMSLNLAIFIAILGSISGISISYFLGQWLGVPFIKRFGPKLRIKEKQIDWVRNHFNKHGATFLIFGYFIPGIRHVTAYVAGFSKYHYFRFAVFAYIGAIFWASTFIILGNILGDQWEYITTFFSQASKIMWLIILTGVLFIILRKIKRN
ncbi:DedA family protein [Virgibacillus sp. Bac330]|uniref:DedA family protein n=1 Tax=Virgibacillus sp. Bac330 TaxID=2419841 RepID=UPI000EF51FAA|nr:DedA family protein [Virgibacillus sp. Bac330]